MELGKVIFSKNINQQLEALAFILHTKDYFSYQINAIDYVDKIYDFANNEIKNFPHKRSPQQLHFLGSNYIFYKSNPRTTWYIFFEKEDDNYLITGIINNHCEEAQFL